MKNSTRPNKPELDATKVPNEIDIAWAAGIYEGEGTCRLCGGKKRSYMVTVVQKDPELLYRLRDWFGGKVRTALDASKAGTWDCCGDRASIFTALIYKFMTARRRAQINATNCWDFLEGKSPDGMGMAELKVVMDEFYVGHRKMVRERVRKARAEQYKQQASDSNWMKATLNRNKRYRDGMTEEQKEAARQYQKDYYQNKKNALHLVQFEDT